MSSFPAIIASFSSKFQSAHLFDKAQDIFALKPFKLKSFVPQKSVLQYNEIKSKYEQQQMQVWRDEWHKNQRKLFIELLICYVKLNKTSPQNIVFYSIIKQQREWELLANIFFHKNPLFLKFQGLSILKATQKIVWTQSDDDLIRANVRYTMLYDSQQGEGNWNDISKSIFFLSESKKFFSPKQIRQRWFNHLSYTIKRGDWSIQQDLIILEHVLDKSKRWCQIVKILGGSRTEHMIKNRYKLLVKNPLTANSQIRIIKLIISKIKKKIQNKKGSSKQQPLSQLSLSLNYQKQIASKIISDFDSNSFVAHNTNMQCHNSQEAHVSKINFVDTFCSNLNFLIPFQQIKHNFQTTQPQVLLCMQLLFPNHLFYLPYFSLLQRIPQSAKQISGSLSSASQLILKKLKKNEKKKLTIIYQVLICAIIFYLNVPCR